MKKLVFNLLIIVFAVAISANTFANDDSLYSVYLSQSTESKKLILSLENMQASKVLCKFLDSNGRVIHKDRIDTRLAGDRKFDLNKLEPGNYTIVIDDLMKVEKLEITLTEDSILFNNNEALVIYKPTVWVNANKTVDFNLLCLGEKAEVKITNDSQVLYEEQFSNETSISKQFNLASLPAGRYTMVISNNGETFFRYIHI